MLAGKPWDDWVAQYGRSHQDPVNRFCHLVGIPSIVLSFPAAIAAIVVHPLWPIAAGLFIGGWALQFIGHAVERKPPKFLRDWRFLLVGVRWWLWKFRN